MNRPQTADFKWNFDLVVFDLDGTLVDSSQDIANAINYTLETLDLAPLPLETIKTFIGRGTMQLVEKALADRMNLAPHALEIFTQRYQQTLHEHTKPFPGVRAILDRLSETNLALMSNKRERFIYPLLEHLKLCHHFQVVAGGDTTPFRKPSPEPLQWVCKRMDISPDRAVMIGDSPVDVEAGKAAGMKTVGLTGGFTLPKLVKEASPDLLIDKVRDLGKWLP